MEFKPATPANGGRADGTERGRVSAPGFRIDWGLYPIIVQRVELNSATLELLRDEAYVILCHEAILSQLQELNRDKTSGAKPHPLPPIPLPPTRRLGALELSHESDPDIALHSRLTQTTRLESWIQLRLRAELSAHLEMTSPIYQCGLRIQQALNEWEFCVRHVLPDSLSEFARELRGLRLAAADAPRRGCNATPVETLALRRIASRVEEQQRQIGRISAAVAGHAQQIGATEVLPPALPNFRRIVWVEWLCVVPEQHRLSEVTRIESEIRTFLNSGLAATLGQIQACRNACSARQDAVLQEYWQRLRTYAQAHFIEERELDTVLDSLALRYEPEIARREGTRIGPFVET
jgi:hypothetical protein